jgi:DNA-binding FadR family transcriptional regulator
LQDQTGFYKLNSAMPEKDKEVPVRSLEKQTMSVQIAENIIEDICAGNYEPGASLPSEQSLASQYGVSRPVVREAFKFLSAQGFVSIANGKGTTIKAVNDELLRVFMRRVLAEGQQSNLKDLFELRISLEKVSASYAAVHRTEKEVEQLDAILQEMERYLDKPAIYSEFDIKFHVLIAEASHNIFMFHLISSIRETLVSLGSRMRQQLPEEKLSIIHAYHISIFKKIKLQDAAGAAKAMEAHFQTAMERLDKMLKADPRRDKAKKI